jgi:UDP-N-acetylglucosamine 4,6-dehydratase/UDP-glucose 4-epimerase
MAMSTDKACDPGWVYGGTKYLMEKLIEEYQNKYTNSKYRVIRCGNILYSTGSVLRIWQESLQNGKEIIITDPDATRYFWSANQVIDFMFDVAKNCNTCEPQSTHMKAVRMGTLLDAMQEKYGKATNIKEIGLQEGENKHEKLTKDGPLSCDDEQYTIEEILELI